MLDLLLPEKDTNMKNSRNTELNQIDCLVFTLFTCIYFQLSGQEDVQAHFKAFKNNDFGCEISSLNFNSVTIKARVQLGVTMMSKMKGTVNHPFVHTP